ncbi:MAG: ribosome small subunit-dependent GTPase A [Oscillospiraceae bacterium]|nr:ribosome small subunit-dependent GTPase A [Oscillospiraceae bacterium]
MTELEKYGWQQSMLPQDVEGIPARITAVHRERFELVCQHGAVFGRLKTAVYYAQGEEFPTVGDYVMLQYEDAGDSIIIKTLERKSFFSRRDPTIQRGEQAIAANFDTVFIMMSLNNDFNITRLERYLTLAWQSGGVPVVLLTKADLINDYETQIDAVQSVAFGVNVIALSIVSGLGLDSLNEYLQPMKSVVFLGSSGVGKSSLLNALANEELMEVKGIREDDSRGRHTTTHRQLFLLPSGAMVIDTPGMRELGMWDAGVGLGEAFGDVDEVLARGCRFADCGHGSEPGCAVTAAIESGELPLERWQSYLKLKNEARFLDDKVSYMRERGNRFKSIAKDIRKSKQRGDIRQ